MYLKRLSCLGFKSFADSIDFDFEPGITAIVGPNGCGKSNVVDAFRWVLGERSAKELRGKEMLDVIFKGTATRQPLGRAEVTLVFDNEDGRLPVDYQEVAVTRRLFRSGESEYEINRQPCRLKDVHSLFADTGIGTSGYSVLEQGAVDGFLHSNPQERRTILEEAAGISRFKSRQRKAALQLERVEANLARLGDVHAEVERQIRSVRIQAQKAQRFLEDRELYKRLRAVSAAGELAEFRAERELVTYRLAELDVRRQLLIEVGNGVEVKGREARAALEELQQELARLREHGVGARMALDRIAQRSTHILEHRAELELAETRRTGLGEELRKVIESYEERRAAARTRLREELELLRACRLGFGAAEERRRTVLDAKTAMAARFRAVKESALEQLFRETRCNNDRAQLENEDRTLVGRRERRLVEDAEFQRELREREREREGLALRSAAVGTSLAETETARALLARELERRDALLTENQRSAAHLREEFERARARLVLLDEFERTQEGVGEGARHLLGTEHPIGADLLGLLAGFVEVDARLARAVDVVLGRTGETVVLRSDAPLADQARVIGPLLDGQSAAICQVGREADILPPATACAGAVLAPPLLAAGGELPSGTQRLAACIRSSPHSAALLARVFEDVLLAESLELAIEHATRPGNRYRYVTLAGCLVEPWGAVAFPAAGGGGLVSRRVEIQQLRQQLTGQEAGLSQLKAAGQELEILIHARRIEERRIAEEAGRLRLEQENLARRHAELDRELRRLTERRSVITLELEEIQRARAALAARIERVKAELETVRSRRQALDEEQRGAEAELEALEARLQTAMQQVALARVAATQSEERIGAARREERQLAEELRERHDRSRRLVAERERDQARAARLDREDAQLASEQLEQRELLHTNEAAEAAVSARAKDWKSKLAELELSQAALRAADDELRGARESDMVRENEIRVRMDGLRDKLREELELDLSALPVAEWRDELRRSLAAAADEDDRALAARLRHELDKVHERLRKNSNVNLEALNELKELEERHCFQTQQLDDLLRARDGLVATIDELNTQSREMFINTFAIVRQHFAELFAKIFGGGNADLQLEEGVDVLEAGIIVTASPPGKRIASLQLMSGGEKALTAIAVLFALFRTRPSPFCLLDEVDAPLDEANNRRFVLLLREFAAQSQFVVITHSKVTMAEAATLYGVTMEEEGVSRRFAVRLEEVDEFAAPRPRASRRQHDSAVGEPELPEHVLKLPLSSRHLEAPAFLGEPATLDAP